MTNRLQIGDVARLVGVSTKTIRYYHEIGLLSEPERSEGGYRLYGAAELLRLRRIRQMKSLGLSLKQIRALPGKSEAVHSLQPVLEGLLVELDRQIVALQETRARVEELLAGETQEGASREAGEPIMLQLVERRLGELFQDIDPALLEQERQLWGLIESFNWPEGHRDRFHTFVERFFAAVAGDPERSRAILQWSEMLVMLATMPAESGEVEKMARDFARGELFRWLADVQEADDPSSDDPLTSVMADLMNSQLKPAQKRFIELVEQYAREE